MRPFFSLIDCSPWISLQEQGGGSHTHCTFTIIPSGHPVMFTKLLQTLASGSPEQSMGQVAVHLTSKCHHLRMEGAGELVQPWSLALERLLTPDPLSSVGGHTASQARRKACWGPLWGDISNHSSFSSCLLGCMAAPRLMFLLPDNPGFSWKVFP